MSQHIVGPRVAMIGPAGVGKTTVSELLAARLGLPCVCLDEIAGRYYAELGFDDATARRLIKEIGFGAFYRQLAPALSHATVRMCAEYRDCVADLGAGHSHFADEHLFYPVKQALGRCRHVALLLPSADLDRSVRILRERSIAERKWDWVADGYDYIEHWVKDFCNHELATMTVYNELQTPAQTCDEIVKRMQ